MPADIIPDGCPDRPAPPLVTLREALAEWQSYDGALCTLHELVGTLVRGKHGCFEPDEWKGLVYSEQDEQEAFWDFVLKLEELGILETHLQGGKVRWNPAYVPPTCSGEPPAWCAKTAEG